MSGTSATIRKEEEFSASLAHELRKPLVAIADALRTIRTPDVEPNRIEAASEVMQLQVDHLLRIVDDLLDTGRSKSGWSRIHQEPAELNLVCSRAIDAVSPFCLNKEQVLTANLPPATAYVSGDSRRLARVIEGVLNNASKFTPRGGHIDVTVENEADSAEIRVRDSGIGLATSQLLSIFDLVVRPDTSSRRTNELGIGLTLCRRIVELCGGTMVAKSAGLGKGSEFVVHLPTRPRPAKAFEDDSASPAQTTPLRILVVDDNRDGAESLARVLELSGQHTRVAADGLTALREAVEFRPDVVLLDIGLPKLNGFEVARRIRRESWGQSVILIAVTGWGQEEHRRESSDAGFNAHLVKPVDPIKLIRMLASLTNNG